MFSPRSSSYSSTDMEETVGWCLTIAGSYQETQSGTQEAGMILTSKGILCGKGEKCGAEDKKG